MKKNVVAHTILLVIATIWLTSAGAQDLTAGNLEIVCASGASQSDRTACALMIGAFRDGFIEGVGKGVIDTYKFDEQLFALVKDVKARDIVPRINRVAQSSTCIQSTSTPTLTHGFIEFMKENPQLRQETYRKALTRTISARFCKK